MFFYPRSISLSQSHPLAILFRHPYSSHQTPYNKVIHFTIEMSKDPKRPSLVEQRRGSAIIDTARLKALGISDLEADGWQNLRTQYLNKDSPDWNNVSPPNDDFFDDYASFEEPSVADIKGFLDKVVILKLNGGLGIRMGLKGPKSAIEVSPGITFLDLTVMHVEHMNTKYMCDIPLVLMNSFNTDEATKKIIHKYAHSKVQITTFQQSKYPRFYKDTMNPVPKPGTSFDPKEWYPPGSGDVFPSLVASGLLDKFIKQGKEYIFISNVENLGAVLDMKILAHVFKTKPDFALEVTDRISTDVTGGFLVKHQNKVHLMELSQVPLDKASHFTPRNYRYWNTNNLWVSLPAIQRVVSNNSLELDFVVTNVASDTSRNQILLETPAGMAIQNFASSRAIHVPRIRYRPVKSTSQLMLAQSNIFQFHKGEMIMNPKREPPTVPLIKLGEEFSSVAEYSKRFKSIPDLVELEHLTVSGDVYFGSDLTLKGTVIIVANHGERVDLTDGAILENKIISGNLRILDH
eukprot:Phypoly_transcript_05914.p1 GENE.Phypoly_transcript_05914~~Phypoly_transcript_05914.p1  ORF type:complete len:519 (+),score=69.14 Phypoly_transcript_05914:182-1738(+)